MKIAQCSSLVQVTSLTLYSRFELTLFTVVGIYFCYGMLTFIFPKVVC